MATINDVLEAVGEDPELASIALEEEMNSEKPRKTLVEALGLLSSSPDAEPSDSVVPDTQPLSTTRIFIGVSRMELKHG